MSTTSLIEVARYRVIFADCDPMRIMYYGNYLRLFEIGRAELFRQLGHPFPHYIAQGLYLGVIEAICRYFKPARYDDELAIRAGVTDVGRARMTISYEVVGPDGSVLVSGHTLLAALNERGRAQRIPPEFKDVAIRLARVFAHATEVFGEAQKAAEWFRRPNQALGGRTPLGVLDTEIGAQEVDDILGRIEHGIFS